MAFALVEKPVGTLDLLLYLLQRGTASVTEILSDTHMSGDTFQRAAGHLKSLGFVFEERQVGFPSHRYLGLTRSGESVARGLSPVADLLASTAQSLDAEFIRLEGAGEAATIPRRLELLEMLVDREFSRGEWDAAQMRAVRLAALARDSGDARREALGHLALGRVLQKRASHDEAVRELGEAVRIAGGGGADDLASEAEYLIGSDLERRGQWTAALERFNGAADRAGRAGDALHRALARQAVARVWGRQGRLEDSLEILREVVGELERAGAEAELPRAYASLGTTAYYLNRPDAVGWWEKAIEAARRTGDARMEAYGMSNAATHWIEAREFRKADAYLKRAMAVFEDLGERTGLAAAELNTANLLAAQDRWSDAERHFGDALRLARETGNRYQEASALFNQGQMMKRRDRRDEARALLTEAKRLFAQLGSAARAARCDDEMRDLTASGTR